MITNTKRLIGWAAIVAIILSIPLIAMQFSTEVNWSPLDFARMGAVLMGLGIIYELIAGKAKQTAYKAAFGLGLLGAFLLFWVNGAVGIIGNENQDANLLYVIVFVIGLVGSLLSRFKARGMSYTLFSAATAQVLVPLVAFLIWPPPSISWSPGVVRVILLSSGFAFIFLLSGLLFRRSVSQ